MNTIKIGTLALSLISTAVTAPAATVLTFGGPGYVSQGLIYDYTVGPQGSATGWSEYAGQDLVFECRTLGKTAKICFSTYGMGQLAVGSYMDLSSYTNNNPPYQTPGFNLINQGKNLPPIVNGWFKVLEIKLNPAAYDYAPLKFAADFIAYDVNGDYTAGSFRWGSNIPATPIAQIVIPEVPSSFLLIGALGLLSCQRRRT
jgi:hypothetical protein